MIFKSVLLLGIRYISSTSGVCKKGFSNTENSAILSVSWQFNLNEYHVKTEIRPWHAGFSKADSYRIRNKTKHEARSQFSKWN